MIALELHCPEINQALHPILIAQTAWERTRGLLARPALQGTSGMLLRHTVAIHTVGMRYPLDLVFLDAAGRIIRISAQVPPWRMRWEAAAKHTLELAAGTCQKIGLEKGMRLMKKEFSHQESSTEFCF